MKFKLQEQSDSIYGRLQSIYDKIIPTNYLALNVVLRDLQKWVFIGIMSLMNLKGHIYLVRMRLIRLPNFICESFDGSIQ